MVGCYFGLFLKSLCEFFSSNPRNKPPPPIGTPTAAPMLRVLRMRTSPSPLLFHPLRLPPSPTKFFSWFGLVSGSMKSLFQPPLFIVLVPKSPLAQVVDSPKFRLFCVQCSFSTLKPFTMKRKIVYAPPTELPCSPYRRSGHFFLSEGPFRPVSPNRFRESPFRFLATAI